MKICAQAMKACVDKKAADAASSSIVRARIASRLRPLQCEAYLRFRSDLQLPFPRHPVQTAVLCHKLKLLQIISYALFCMHPIINQNSVVHKCPPPEYEGHEPGYRHLKHVTRIHFSILFILLTDLTVNILHHLYS